MGDVAIGLRTAPRTSEFRGVAQSQEPVIHCGLIQTGLVCSVCGNWISPPPSRSHQANPSAATSGLAPVSVGPPTGGK